MEIENFEKNRFLIQKNLLPLDICRIATKYALIQENVKFQPEEEITGQVPGAHSVYGDTLMETIMFFIKPHIEKLTDLSLSSTYTYFRVYRPGQDLKRHKDRPSCEISTTICLGYNYAETPTEYNWGMYVDPDSITSENGPNGEFISNNKPGFMIEQHPGDIIIYRGCELEHWREPLQGNKNTYQVQVFCHFINKNGPFYPDLVYDGRKGLGYPAI